MPENSVDHHGFELPGHLLRPLGLCEFQTSVLEPNHDHGFGSMGEQSFQGQNSIYVDSNLEENGRDNQHEELMQDLRTLLDDDSRLSSPVFSDGSNGTGMSHASPEPPGGSQSLGELAQQFSKRLQVSLQGWTPTVASSSVPEDANYVDSSELLSGDAKTQQERPHGNHSRDRDPLNRNHSLFRRRQDTNLHRRNQQPGRKEQRRQRRLQRKAGKAKRSGSRASLWGWAKFCMLAVLLMSFLLHVVPG